MSVVTNVVVHVQHAPEEVYERLTEPLPFDMRGQQLAKMPPNLCGGVKVMETDLFTAGFNYVLAEDFAEWFASLPWNRVSEATVSIYEQEGEGTILVRTLGRTEVRCT